MLDVSAEPQDGFLESDFDVHVQVISHSLEIAVGLHDQAEDEVPRQVVRMLLTFPLKYDFLPVFHPGFHHDRIVLRFLDHLLSLTNWAVIGTHFPLPLTAHPGHERAKECSPSDQPADQGQSKASKETPQESKKPPKESQKTPNESKKPQNGSKEAKKSRIEKLSALWWSGVD